MENISEFIGDIQYSLGFLLPEYLIIALFFVNIGFAIAYKKENSSVFDIVNLLFYGVCAVIFWVQMQDPLNTFLFSDALKINKTILVFKFLFSLCALLSVVFKIANGQKNSFPDFIYYTSLCGLVLGATFLSMAANMLMVFLNFEIVSISAYILIASQDSKKSAEAATKYLLFGLFSSALMLYGISLFYGFTGSFNFYEPQFVKNLTNAPIISVSFAFFLFFCGVLFKIGAVPFHFWVAEVYESSSFLVIATVSTISKIAGIVLLMNFMPTLWQFDFKNFVIWFDPEFFIAVVALFTILLGNFQALIQTNVKRLLAFSSIAHTGFMLLPLASFESHAQESLLYYVFVYVLMSFAAFVVMAMVMSKDENINIVQLKGIGMKYPLMGIMVIINMVALTGLPPTNGFWAKFYVFSSVWDAYTLEQERLFLFIFILGILNTVVSLFYYIKVPFLMFKKDENAIEISRKPILMTFSVILSAILLITFVMPELLKL